VNNPHRPLPELQAVPPPEDDVEELEATPQMSFLQHLEDLRQALWKSAVAVAAGMAGGWFLAPRVLQDLISRTVKHAVVLSPFEMFNERFKLTFILGLSLALPVVFWQAWSFVVPGLLKRERTWVPWLAIGSMILFALGGWAAYGYVVPLVVHVLEQFLVPGVTTEIRLSSLLEFTYNLAIACGLLMQMPMVALLLTAIGLVTPQFLLRQWRAAIVVIFVVTAIITPGDVVSAQVIMGAPMALLYFISVGLSFLVARKRAKKDREEGWS
jgi:sec-independent protein translocase protein TatC